MPPPSSFLSAVSVSVSYGSKWLFLSTELGDAVSQGGGMGFVPGLTML